MNGNDSFKIVKNKPSFTWLVSNSRTWIAPKMSWRSSMRTWRIDSVLSDCQTSNDTSRAPTFCKACSTHGTWLLAKHQASLATWRIDSKPKKQISKYQYNALSSNQALKIHQNRLCQTVRLSVALPGKVSAFELLQSHLFDPNPSFGKISRKWERCIAPNLNQI